MQILKLFIWFITYFTCRNLVTFIMDDDAPLSEGLFFVGLLFGCSLVLVLLRHQYTMKYNIIGLRVQSTLLSAIYKKVMHLLWQFHVKHVGFVRTKHRLTFSVSPDLPFWAVWIGRDCQSDVCGCAESGGYGVHGELLMVLSHPADPRHLLPLAAAGTIGLGRDVRGCDHVTHQCLGGQEMQEVSSWRILGNVYG